MITVRDIKAVEALPAGKNLIISLYLNVGTRRFSREHILALAHRLLEERITSCQQEFSEEEIESLAECRKRIEDFLRNDFKMQGNVRGLAIIASHDHNLFQTYCVPQSFRSQAFIASRPYLRPLMTVLSEYRRIMLVVLDHREARFIAAYMGNAWEHPGYHSDTQRKVREGGWYGLEERKIARRIENQVLRHYKEVADLLFEHFQSGYFEYLFVGIKEEEYPLFCNFLHSYVRGVLRGRVNVNPKDQAQILFEEALRLERLMEDEEDTQIIERLLETVETGGLAIYGLKRVLYAVNLGACQTLVVDDSYEQEGYACERCGCLSLSSERCGFCGDEETKEVQDLMERTIEEVLAQNGEIKYIYHTHPKLATIEHIGAFLRFQV